MIPTKNSMTTNLHDHLKVHHPNQAASIPPRESTAPSSAHKQAQPSIIGAFSRTTKYKRDSLRWGQCTESVTRFLAKEMMAFHTVEKPSFKEMLSTFDKQYELPTRKYFSKTAMPKMYLEMRAKVMDEIKMVDFIALTTDMWSSVSMMLYMSLTVHYVKNWKVTTRCLETSFLPDDHTKEWPWLNCFGHNLNVAITNALDAEKDRTTRAFALCRSINCASSHSWKRKKQLKEAQIELNIPQHSLIMDCATRWGSKQMAERILEQIPAIKRVFAEDRSRRPLPTITWQDEAVFTRQDEAVFTRQDEAVFTRQDEAVITRQDEAVFTRQDEAVFTRQDEAVITRQDEAVITRQDEAVFTRQDEAVFTRQDEAVFTRQDEAVITRQDEAVFTRQDEAVITRQDEAVLDAVNKALKPLAEFTDILSRETYVTISSLLPTLYLLRDDVLRNKEDDVRLTSAIKSSVLQELDRKYDFAATLQLMSTSALLDPRYKSDHIDTRAALDSTVTKLKAEMVEVWRRQTRVRVRVEEDSEEVEMEQDAAVAPHAKKARPSLGLLLGKVKPQKEALTDEQRATAEVAAYLQEEVIAGDSDPLAWWSANESRFPLLANIAKKYLCICATSTPSERVFSTAGNVLTPKRSLLKPDKVNMLVFLAKNL
ncbi:hypothetical protein SKAU_G00274580 [Synaphobranchus kaupii]|uniref:HAT C-terminal dimerisation domain-containing protein n=1 Tax=Synaphobranchus kaupii TaxID=118154 RepID=A0A9Q1IQX7_SYNKA|nr:hypothetical protein SKAU_G00274580 [Synaphobranchus kaupii]